MIVIKQNSLNLISKNYIIKGLTQLIIIIAIWILVWVIEEILLALGILNFVPVLVIPTTISASILMSYLLKFSIIFVFLSIKYQNSKLYQKVHLKIISKKNYCLIPSLDLVIFGFECHLPTRDQIKNIEGIYDYAPFTIEIIWETGLMRFFFYRPQIEKSHDEYAQMWQFLEKSFDKSNQIPSNIINDLFQTTLTKQTQKKIEYEYITKNEEFSDILRSLKSNDDFLKENRQNEEFNYSIDIHQRISI